MPKRGEYSANAKARSVQQRAYNSKPSSKKDRASRNAARRMVVGNGSSSKDVDHRDGNPRNNSRGNLRLLGISSNRGRRYRA